MSQVDLSYHNYEQARGTNPRTSPVMPSDCPDAGLIIGVVALVITLALALLMAHTTYEQHAQTANLQKLKDVIGQSDADKFKEYRALIDQVRFATEMITVNYRHSPRTRRPQPSPEDDPHPSPQDGPQILERSESF